MIDLPTMTEEMLRDEGCRLTVYDDATGQPITSGTTVLGHPTLGVGRSIDAKGLTHLEAQILLAGDIAEYLWELARYPWFVAMDAGRKRAIVNMRHQLGLTGLLGFHDMIAEITAQNWPLAAAAGAKSKWAISQTPARAARVLALLRDGDPV